MATDELDENGLRVKTAAQLRADLETGFRNAYGADINIEQNSPDGQMIGIIEQQGVDIRELAVSINAGFDPDQATGVVLDQRVALNNITRRSGTYTTQPIDITVDRTLTLDGLDADFNNPDGVGYSIQDGSGNEFILVDTDTLVAGTHTRNFRAREIGQVETTVGTITNFVTIVLGVTSVNNSSGALQTGQNEETDMQLRVRRRQSVAIASTGYLNGIEAAFRALDGVTDARVFENVTNTVDADGIPAHGFWAIVEGGANTEIANVIYTRKSYGSNLTGDVTVNIPRPTGDTFVARFDRPTAENLHVRFEIQPTQPDATFDQDAIKDAIVAALSYDIGAAAETSTLTCTAMAVLNAQGGGGVPVNMEVSDNGTGYVDFLETSTKDRQFVLDATRITITEL